MSGPGSGGRLTEAYEALRRGDLGALRALGAGQARRSWAYLSESIGPLDPEEARRRWIRPKGNLTRGELALLLAVAIVPLLMMAARISASPGVLGPSLSGSLLSSIGSDLNQYFSLYQIPANDRERVLYLLFIPTGAMLIALARLTFGLKVIGFRSILIALGFQASGTVPSLILIAVMVSIVVLVRPTLVRMRLPYYARVSVIMSISVMVLLGALVLAPWLRSEVMWGVGFFPVIVLGLLAEGIAKTLDRDSGLVAIWRTGMTIGIALVLAAIGQLPALRELALRFPELVVTQVVAVILISEYLDLRLFQDLDSRLSGVPIPRLLSGESSLRVALVCNRKKAGIVGRVGLASGSGYRRRTIRRVTAALRSNGHAVKVIEGDISMLSKVRNFIPAQPWSGEPGGLVLNLSHGIQGSLPPAHVPAMLEMAGVAYTGPAPQGHLITHDKLVMGAMLERAGVPTPERLVVRGLDDVPSDLAFPVVVKPRRAHRYRLRVARNRARLEKHLHAVSRRYGGEIVLEHYLPGREIQVACIGNGPAELLPVVERDRGAGGAKCPAPIDAELARRIREAALAAFDACACRDYALMTFCLSRTGEPFLVDVEQVDVLEEEGAFELAASAAGLDFGDLLERILEAARSRYRTDPAAPALTLVTRKTARRGEAGRDVVAG